MQDPIETSSIRPSLGKSIRIPMAVTCLVQILLFILFGSYFLRPELDERTQPYVPVEAQEMSVSAHLTGAVLPKDTTTHLAIVYPRYGYAEAKIFSERLALEAEYSTHHPGEPWEVLSGDMNGDGQTEWLLGVPLNPDIRYNEFSGRDNALRLVVWRLGVNAEPEIDRLEVESTPGSDFKRFLPWRGIISPLGQAETPSLTGDNRTFALGVSIIDPPTYVREIRLYRKGDPPHRIANVGTALFPTSGVWSALSNGEHVLTVGGTVVSNGLKVPITWHDSEGTVHVDTLSDTQGSLVQVNENGEVQWARELAHSGGKVFVYPLSADRDQLLVVFSRFEFNGAQDEVDVFRVDAATGDLLSTDHEIASYQHLVGLAAREMGLAGVLRISRRRIRWLYRNGTIGPEVRISGKKVAGDIPTVKMENGIHAVAFTKPNGQVTFFFTKKGRCVASASRLLAPEVERIHLFGQNLDVVPLKSDNYSTQQLIYFQKNPFVFWWMWRYRWLVVLLFGPPLITLAVTATQRYMVERRIAVHAMRVHNLQLRHLTRRLHESQEQERTRISHDIHDGIGQSLAVVRWGIAELAKNGTRPKKKLHDLLSQVDEALGELRRIAQELRPGLLDDMGLEPALEWYLATVARRTGLAIDFDSSGELDRLEPELATGLYRIVQEGISNVIKHAQASQVQVELHREEDNIRLAITDDGKGLVAEERDDRPKLGLMGMRERLLPFGGEVALEEGDSRGAVLRILVPMGLIDDTQGKNRRMV